MFAAIAAVAVVALVLWSLWIERRPCKVEELLECERPEHVVVLIHGTFARSAAWTAAESTLSRSVVEKLGSQSTALRRLVWSGGNTLEARLRAANELRAVLAEQLDRWPTAQHHLIAHSHGGNVALYALNDERYASLRRRSEGLADDEQREVAGALAPLRDRVSTVTCLATPFLQLSRRDLVGGPARFAILAPLPLLLVAYGVLDHLDAPWWTALIAMVGFGAALASLAWWHQRLGRLVTRLDLAADRLQGKLRIVRMVGDEASAGLLAGQFAAALTARIFARLGAMETAAAERHSSRGASRATVVAAVAAAIGLPIWGLAWWLDAGTTVDVGKTVGLGGVAFLLLRATPIVSTLLVYLGSALAFPLALLLSLVLIVPFGPRIAFGNLFLDVSIEATPPGEWSVSLLAPDGGDDASLRHSAPYRDPRVLELLSDWLSGDPVG